MDLPFKPPVFNNLPNLPEVLNPNYFQSGLLTSPGVQVGNRREILLAHAQQYVDFGYIPIPLSGKRPILNAWEQTTRQNALSQIRTASNFDNLGVLTGERGGITVIDIDNSSKIRGSDSFIRILNEAGESYPSTLRVATGGGGVHLYFRYAGPELLSAPLRLHGQRQSIDIKNNGGQVVAPGAIHPDTKKPYFIDAAFPVIEMPKGLKTKLLEYQQS